MPISTQIIAKIQIGISSLTWDQYLFNFDWYEMREKERKECIASSSVDQIISIAVVCTFQFNFRCWKSISSHSECFFCRFNSPISRLSVVSWILFCLFCGVLMMSSSGWLELLENFTNISLYLIANPPDIEFSVNKTYTESWKRSSSCNRIYPMLRSLLICFSADSEI